MKMFKKLAAMATALVMAVGMMSFGASAATDASIGYIYFGLTGGGDTKTIGGNGEFSVTKSGKLTIGGYCDVLQGTGFEISGLVYDNSVFTGNGYGAWVYVVSKNVTKTGTIMEETKSYSNARIGNAAKVQLTLAGTAPNYYAHGNVAAY